MEWVALVISLAFVAAGSFAILRHDALAAHRAGRPAVDPPVRSPSKSDSSEDAPTNEPAPTAPLLREPSEDERQLLRNTIDAFEGAGALRSGDVDPVMLWRASQRIDPGPALDVYAALTAFSGLEEIGRSKPRRLTFVPVGTEYDAALIAGLTAEILRSLGHEVAEDDVTVELPSDGSEGAAAVAFAIDGGWERVPFHFRWKLHPPELFEALAGFTREDDPREVVCADSDYQQLLYAAIRPGALARLNQRFAIDDLFGPP